MKRRTIGEILFWGATVVALALYWVTAPDGLPWNPSATSHPVWRYCVAMAGGNPIVLTSLAAAVSGGLIAAMVNRYLGWRLGAAAALVWIFLPGVWNRAITGERGVFLAAAVVIAAWTLNAILLRVFRTARKVAKSESSSASITAHGDETKRGKVNRIASWLVLGAAGLFVIVSATTLHSYRYGEAASAYARLIVEEAGDRIILLNGACDEQVVDAASCRVRKDGENSTLTRQAAASTISFRTDDANRSNIVAWAKSAFPAETNLWLAAQVGPAAFADAAVKAHPDRFYTMMGQSTTPEKWAARWEAMKPYLDSGDKFIPQMRHIFAYEANTLGNVLQGKGDLKAAWNLYLRIFEEIDPKNPAACVNLNGMLRRGYKVDEGTRQRVESAQADFMKLLKDKENAARVAARIAAFGPVMRDQKAYDELRERVRKRMEELEKKGEKLPLSAELKTLTEWKDEMMKSFGEGNIDKAARIARAILSRRQWQGFIPANMVLGEQMLLQGDLVAAEAFLRVAIEGKGEAAPPLLVLNDYAEVLRLLKRYDEAEKYVRQAVEGSDEKKGWVYRLTLAQILRDAGKNPEEVQTLVKDALKHAPVEARERIRKEFPR